MFGTVKFFNDIKGFGFIIREDGGGDVFVHATTLKKSGIEEVEKGDRLAFDVEKSDKGMRAVNISRA